MPTDYACHTAAEQAAHCLAPVSALLAPDAHGPMADAEVMPVVLRNYLGAGRPAQATVRTAAPVVTVSTGALAVRLCLEGLRAEMEGALSLWHAGLAQRLPEVLGGRGRAGAREWQVLQDLQAEAQEVLTLLAHRERHGPSGARMLGGQIMLLEDVLCGSLRRLAVPVDAASECAGGLARAVGSLFGLGAAPVAH
ncbi:hypothetical protein [Streptomyces sp. NPDC006997]|uniref:hypothetical protein n=1 Tax=Streptomyces sp. NPDC006997 TaxID=3155356 RepID=UPI0033E4A1F2